MPRKYGEYQKRKERKTKITNVLCILILIVVTSIILYGIVQNAVNIRDVDYNSLNQYTGTYVYELKARIGKGPSHYRFTLDNGDVVLTIASQVQNDQLLDDQDKLTVQYTTMYTNPLHRQYSAVSIASADGAVEFLDLETSRRESVSMIWILSFLLMLIILSVAVLVIIVRCTGKYKVYHNNRKYNR